MNRVSLACTCLLTLALALPASAATLELTPGAQTVALGEQTSVDLFLSGVSAVLGGFDLDVTYAPALLALSSVVFSGALGDSALAEAQLESTPAGPGTVNLFGLSFLTEAELAGLQGASIPIATLVFDTLAKGTSPVGLPNVLLSDAAGAELVTASQGGSVTIPEPALTLLLAAGAAGLVRRALC